MNLRLVIPVLLLAIVPFAPADDFSGYEVRSGLTFHFPATPEPALRGPAVFENLADGRLLVLSTRLESPDAFTGTPELYVESAVGSRDFQPLGDLPLLPGASWPSFGGAFLEVSPDGSRVAFGDNSFVSPHVGIVDVDTLLSQGASAPVDWYAQPHFLASWLDNQYLALSYAPGATSSVAVLDALSSPAAPLSREVLTGIGGASGAVAIDASGRLYTGNGFDGQPGGSETGTIRRFEEADWRDAFDANQPLEFENDGQLVDRVLSASSLEFDREGSLLIGGSDFFGGGDANFLAVRRETPGPEQRTFDPNADYESSYVLAYNEVTHEIYAYEPFALLFGDPIDATRAYVVSPPVPGDATGEGLVTGADYTIWADNFGLFNGDAEISDGDFNGDGFVTGADYTVWADNFNLGPGHLVPEPSGATLAALGATLMLASRRRNRRAI